MEVQSYEKSHADSWNLGWHAFQDISTLHRWGLGPMSRNTDPGETRMKRSIASNVSL